MNLKWVRALTGEPEPFDLDTFYLSFINRIHGEPKGDGTVQFWLEPENKEWTFKDKKPFNK